MLSTAEYSREVRRLPDPSKAKTGTDRILVRDEKNAIEAMLKVEWVSWLAQTYLPGFPAIVTDEVFVVAESFGGHIYNYAGVDTQYSRIAKLLTL